VDLRSTRVHNYKSIHDSGAVTVEPNVTCLVGKNESGKTALLEALYRLKPVPSGHPQTFDALRDYPRRFYGRDKAKIASLAVIDATYELSDGEVTLLEGRYGAGCVSTRFVTMTRGYSNEITCTPIANDDALLAHLKTDTRLAGVDVSAATDVSAVRAAIDSIVEPPGPLAELRTWLNTEPSDRVYTSLGTCQPSFIYFSQYNILPGVVSIKRLQTVDEEHLEPGERTALSLLRLAGVESEEFDEANYEARKAALEAAANTLTDEVFEFWTQNTELQIELDIEFRQTEAVPALPEPFLQIRIRNNRHRVTLNFSERSAGFVWFFSFLAYFSEFRDSEDKHILLLDEPGLNLHGTAQADLLRYIDERLATDHQVLYTTHSPFMVQADRLERARLVEDVDKVGTIVKDDALGTTEETQFPLHAAIGIRVTQTLFLGPSTLIVEGNADLLYIRTLSRHLEEQGRMSLDDQWTVLPVGGLDKMPTFMALLSPQVYVVALHDVPKTVPKKLQNLVDRKIIDANQLLPLTEVTGGKEADIEDMFDETFYLQLLGESGTATVAKAEMKGTGRIIPRVEKAFGGKFSHYAPARHLAVHAGNLMPSAPAKTLDRFESLFKKLNERLPKP
jgi:hypothetical protein